MNLVHNFPPCFSKIHFDIFPSTLRSSEWSLPSRFLAKMLYECLFSPICATCPAHLILLDLEHTNHEAPHYAVFSTSSIMGPTPQHVVLKIPSMFCPLSERPSFVPMQNRRQNYSFVPGYWLNHNNIRTTSGDVTGVYIHSMVCTWDGKRYNDWDFNVYPFHKTPGINAHTLQSLGYNPSAGQVDGKILNQDFWLWLIKSTCPPTQSSKCEDTINKSKLHTKNE